MSSQFWNPATTSLINEYGFISESNLSLVLPNSEASFGGTDSGNVGEWAFVPASAYSYGVNDKLTLGLTFGAPFGLATDAKNTWAGAILGDRSEVQTYTLGPSVSYKINDWIAVGLGAQIEYMTMYLDSRSGGSKVFKVDADDIGLGFTAGLMLTPTDSTQIGLGFRSSIHHNLKGDGQYLGTPADMSGEFDTPEMVTLGIRQQVNERFALLAGVEWTNWSRFKELAIESPTVSVPVVEEDWSDGWYVSLGGEYAYSDKLVLRAGAAYEDSPVPDSTRTPRIPDNNRVWLSAGASYKLTDTFSAHLAYSHVFMQDGEVDQSGITTSFDQHLDIVSVGLTSDW